MLDYIGLALAASIFIAPISAVPYVTPPEKNILEPQLHYSKATQFTTGSEKVLSSKNSESALTSGAVAYSLVDSYDHTNWMSKFSVQSVCLILNIK